MNKRPDNPSVVILPPILLLDHRCEGILDCLVPIGVLGMQDWDNCRHAGTLLICVSNFDQIFAGCPPTLSSG
jgi:hypothetical protein